MQREAGGDFVAFAAGLGAGADYILEAGPARYPDPVSRWQPYGVHGPSRTVDPGDFRWTDGGWKGIPLRDYVLYELHTGIFTPEGTFQAIIARLPYLKELGVTAIELMPVAEFPGSRNWGYDGVALYAPHSAYGGPDGLKALVDACHREGLAVVLDVVYNHLGPEGNYLAKFGPYFTGAYHGPWGQAINFDGAASDGVRRFFIDNALYWLTEFHIDALRLDAIHAIYDMGARHVLEEMASAFHRQAESLGRAAFLIAESDLNDARVVRPPAAGGHGLDAQWLDDFHHALRGLLTGDGRGYLGDFGRVEDLAKSLRDGFVYDGRYSAYRRRRHGNSASGLPGERFAACIQNHDQVANASLGTRLDGLVTMEARKLAAAVLICAPFLPLLFNGQEYGEIAPFFYFTSFGDEALIEAVRKGRRKEYAAFYTDSGFPDPQDPRTFERCRLDWTLLSRPPHDALLAFYRRLLGLRRRHACLSNGRRDLLRAECGESARWLVFERSDPAGERALMLCNFNPRALAVPLVYPNNGWRLAIWGGEAQPPDRPDGGEVLLGPWGFALYLRPAADGQADL